MENKIKLLLDSMEYEDLLKLKDDLIVGSPIYKKLVFDKLQEIETSHRSVCASCGGKVNSKSDAYTLLFGERTIRKKASFCGMDCLQEFIGKLAIQNRSALEKEVSIKTIEEN